MLTILGGQEKGRFCDGVSRRSFLKIGGLALGGMSMPDILRAEAAASTGRSHKSIIMIFQPGGPPHQDMYDLKPNAPVGIRGEFQPIKTNVPGIEVCELLPRMAGMMDKLVPIRTIVGATGKHYSFQCLTGHSHQRQPPGGWPELGSTVAKLKGATGPTTPPYVGLSPKMQHLPYNSGKPGFLGPAYAPFQPNGEGKGDLVLNGITLDRLGDRERLVSTLDSFNRHADLSGMMDGMDIFQQQALGVLTSSTLAEALDLEKEDKRVRDRYGYGTATHQGDGAPRLMQQFLMARRLVEAGVRCVTLSFSFWDWHINNFGTGRANLPALDQGVTALVEDLHRLGLDKDVAVVVWGEFGRTPKINKRAGRDHWPQVSCGLLAGGGMRTGQVIGTTDKLAGEPKDRPVHFQEVFATLYKFLGIDLDRVTLSDLAGRPRYLVDPQYGPMPEVLGT